MLNDLTDDERIKLAIKFAGSPDRLLALDTLADDLRSSTMGKAYTVFGLDPLEILARGDSSKDATGKTLARLIRLTEGIRNIADDASERDWRALRMATYSNGHDITAENRFRRAAQAMNLQPLEKAYALCVLRGQASAFIAQCDDREKRAHLPGQIATLAASFAEERYHLDVGRELAKAASQLEHDMILAQVGWDLDEFSYRSAYRLALEECQSLDGKGLGAKLTALSLERDQWRESNARELRYVRDAQSKTKYVSRDEREAMAELQARREQALVAQTKETNGDALARADAAVAKLKAGKPEPEHATHIDRLASVKARIAAKTRATQ